MVERKVGGLFVLLFFLAFHECDGVGASTCRLKLIQKELYRNVFKVIKDNAILASEKSTTNVELLDLAIPLAYEDFNPGKTSIFTQPGALPSSVIENGLSLVDKIYPTGTHRFRVLGNSSSITDDYRFDSFSSTYDYVLSHMMLLPRNFSDQDVLRAKYYLQELVPNPERVLRNESKLPRFLLYDYYRANYLNEKGNRDDAVDSNRDKLTQLKFELWGQKKLSRYESDTDAAYVKWQAFGYKAEVEKQLQYFDVDTHEEKLMSSRALYKSVGRPSEREAHVTIHPFTLEPANWYKELKVILTESADELQYKKSLLLAKQALLNATKYELNKKTNSDITQTQEEIERSLSEIQTWVDNGVDKLLQMEVDCFTRVNLSVCAEIIDGHTAFRALLVELAEHFAQSEYLKSILNRKTQVVQVIQEQLYRVNSEIRILDSLILKREKEEAGETIEASTSSDKNVTSCPGVGQIQFLFDSENIDSSQYCQDFEDGNDDVNDCIDVEVPANATSRDLWNVNSCSVDSELISFNMLEPFVKLMNSIPIKITASLLKVNVYRSWFDPSLFEDSDHFTMKRGRGVVSPGPLSPSILFQREAHSGNYLLPHYVSAFIVASNIQIFYPGLGSWDTSSDNATNEAINILMKYAYAPVLTGGVGPFSFQFPAGYGHNYQLRRKQGGLLMTLPGGQVIGYILKTVPKFPLNQTDPHNDTVKCEDYLTSSQVPRSRSKRSMSEDASSGSTFNIKNLARSLFSEGLGPVIPADHLELMRDRDVVSTKYIEKLIREGDMKREELAEFIHSFDRKDSNPAAAANSTAEEYAYE